MQNTGVNLLNSIEHNGYDYDTCLKEIFYLEQKIYEWFAKEYGERISNNRRN